MELYAQKLHFLGDTEEDRARDCCIHGSIVFKIGDKSLSDEKDWCVSASAYRFLHTLFANHFAGPEDFMIPCCGHFLIPSKDKQTVEIAGCSKGIDFDIIHEQETILIRTTDGAEYKVPVAEYKNAVLFFVKQVDEFFKENPARNPTDDFDRDGFEAFMTEWRALCDRAFAIGDNFLQIKPFTLDDYDICTENDIVYLGNAGIRIKRLPFINFRECAHNFRELEGGAGNCVGDRETEGKAIIFYASPKPVMVRFFEKNGFLAGVLKKKQIFSFHEVQKRLAEYGYTVRDI